MRRKRIFLGFSAFFEDAYLKRLEKYAEEGWIPIAIGGHTVLLEECKPQQLVFSLRHKELEDDEHLEEIARRGWTHVEGNVFYRQANTYAEAIDDTCEEKYKKKRKAYALTASWLLLCISLYGVLLSIQLNDGLSISLFTNNAKLLLELFLVVTALSALSIVIYILYWLIRSPGVLKREDRILEPSNFLVKGLMVFPLLYLVVSLLVQFIMPFLVYLHYVFGSSFYIASIIPLLTVALVLSRYMRGKKIFVTAESRGSKILVLLVICSVILLAFLLPIIHASYNEESKDLIVEIYKQPSVSLYDLTGEHGEVNDVDVTSSLLVPNYYQIHENSDSYTLYVKRFELVNEDVKNLFLSSFEKRINDLYGQKEIIDNPRDYNCDTLARYSKTHNTILFSKDNVVCLVIASSTIVNEPLLDEVINRLISQ